MNFEPESKRPRIALESSETNLLTGTNDQASEEANGELRGRIQRNDIQEKRENAEHVVRVTSEETCELREGTNDENDGSVSDPSKSGVQALREASVSEKDVGILEFVSNLPGFHGVLKQRFTDFIVKERDIEGNLVHLTDTSIPQDEKTKEFDLDILSQEEKEKIQEVADDEEKKKSVTLSPDDDKEHRRLVHRAIRENFSSLGKEILSLTS